MRRIKALPVVDETLDETTGTDTPPMGNTANVLTHSSAAMRYAGTLSACGLNRGAREAGPRLDVGRPPWTIVVLALRIWALITESRNSVRVARAISA
jgi:hypothetical protein